MSWVCFAGVWPGLCGRCASRNILIAVSGSLLRLVSMLVLTAVIGMSTARAICLFPCLLDASASDRTPGSSAHCDHTGTSVASKLSSGESCDSCDSIGISEADRLSSRSAILDDLIAPARVRVSLLLPPTSGRAHRETGAPPDRRPSTEAPLPLRI